MATCPHVTSSFVVVCVRMATRQTANYAVCMCPWVLSMCLYSTINGAPYWLHAYHPFILNHSVTNKWLTCTSQQDTIQSPVPYRSLYSQIGEYFYSLYLHSCLSLSADTLLKPATRGTRCSSFAVQVELRGLFVSSLLNGLQLVIGLRCDPHPIRLIYGRPHWDSLR